MLDLRNMVQANLFKSIALPTGNILSQMTPVVFVTSMIVLNETEIEQRVEVSKLIHHITF